MNDDDLTISPDDTRLRRAGTAVRRQHIDLPAPPLAAAARRRARKRTAATAVLTTACLLGVAAAASTHHDPGRPVQVAAASGGVETGAPALDPTTEPPDTSPSSLDTTSTSASSTSEPGTTPDTGPTTDPAPSAPPSTSADTTPPTDAPDDPPMTITAPPPVWSTLAVHVVRADDWQSGEHGLTGEPGTPLDEANLSITGTTTSPNNEMPEWRALTSGGNGPGLAYGLVPPGHWTITATLWNGDDESCWATGTGTVTVDNVDTPAESEVTVVVSSPAPDCDGS